VSSVSIVHCIDTEGPLHEPVKATYERLQYILGIDTFEFKETEDNLNKILSGEIDLRNSSGNSALSIISPHLLKLNNTWDKIYKMYEDINESNIRFGVCDNNKNPWKFTFHVLDHVGYEYNPRRRTIGFNAIFDEYLNISNNEFNDEIEFHFHPMNYTKDAHRCATAYDFGDTFNQILCRKLIDREYFPSSYRAGFQAIRHDSNLILEQWIPFDISNMSEESYEYLKGQNDFSNGRSGDWRGAPNDWSLYSPSLTDWRKKGNLKRKIARALNPLNRIGSLTQPEMDKAFETASQGIPVIVGIASHDWRDLRTEMTFCQNLIKKASEKYDVPFYFESTREAFRRAGDFNSIPKEPEITLYWNEDDVPEIKIDASNSDLFMMQPFIAIKTKAGTYFRDNSNLGSESIFYYAFYFDTIETENVDSVGIALTSKNGEVWTSLIKSDLIFNLKKGDCIKIKSKHR